MLKYRPDIDGLRAIAVASVVVYHLDESLLYGGFVGVDIFFVISGYLITQLIYGELQRTGTFSFARFYLRRIRRLFPALFATLLLCLVAAYRLFSPSHLVEFGQSLIASIFSVSNFFFWSLAGYFDSDSSLKPLLHTWSLSVEEQFYLIWPAVLVGLYLLKRRWLIPAFILVMSIASFVLNKFVFSEQVLISSWFGMQDNQSALDIRSTAFYWLPFRVFEFSAGALFVWMNHVRLANGKLQPWLNEASFLVGLVLLVFSVTSLNSAMDFPSTAALVPCIGAALMIYSGPSHRLSWIVSNRLMVGGGLISYSLYLIHWPLIVFYKYWSGVEIGPASAAMLAIISIIMAYLMYRFVEQPFRKPASGIKSRLSDKRFVIKALVSTSMIVTVSANAVMSDGWLWRYPPEILAQLTFKPEDSSEYFWLNMDAYKKNGFKHDGKPKVLLVGDSMAADLLNVLVVGEAIERFDFSAILVGHNCKALFNLAGTQYSKVYGGGKEVCRNENKRIFSMRDRFVDADTIILASYWWEPRYVDYIESTARYLKSISKARIMVLGLKVQKNNGIWFLNKHVFSPQIHEMRTPLHTRTIVVNSMLQKHAQNFQYFDLLDRFCNSQGCLRVTPERYVIVFDGTHLSQQGAEFLSNGIQKTDWYRTMLQQ